mmetsp:Transcript_14206/g.34034  ORF Transcript_14206/g.34034 Transcript_14206/m.34034 type:complete len:366 (+) Transcript_14206:330-1427(+)
MFFFLRFGVLPMLGQAPPAKSLVCALVFVMGRHLLSAHVGGHINFIGQFRNVDLKARLHLVQNLLVGFAAHKGNGNTLGTETTRTSDAVQELVRIIGKVVVDHHIDAFDIDTTSKQVGGDQDACVKILERFVLRDAFFLLHTRVNANGWKVALRQQSVQFLGASNLGNKNDNLIEFQRIQQVVEFSVLFGFRQLGEVELQTMKGQFGFVIHVDFHGILAKLFANGSDFFGQRGAEQQDLLFVGCHAKDFLHIPTHIERFQDTITFVQHKVLDTRQFESFFGRQGQNTSRSTNDNVRMIFGQDLSVLFDIYATIKDGRFDGGQVLGKAFVLVGNLKGQFTSVAQDQHLHVVFLRIFIRGAGGVELM